MTVPGAYGYGGYGGSGAYGNAAGFPVLGFDPAPGEVAAVHALAARFRGLAERVAQARQTLVHLSQPGGAWQGQAAQAFSGTIGEMPGLMGKADQSLGEAGSALDRWSGELPRMQDQARMYERQAEAAQQQLQAAEANPALDAGGPLGGLVGEPLSPEQQQAKQQAQQALDAAQGELQRVRASAEELRGLHHQTAAQIERSVRTAMELAPTQNILEWIGGVVQAAEDLVSHTLQQTWQWIQDHAEDIAFVGDVLGTISGVLGLLSLIPGLQVLGLVALGLGAAAMALHGLAKTAGADVSWKTIALDGLGIVLGVGGLAAGARAASAARAAKAVRGTNAARAASGLRVSRRAQQVARSTSRSARQWGYAGKTFKGAGAGYDSGGLINQGWQWGTSDGDQTKNSGQPRPASSGDAQPVPMPEVHSPAAGEPVPMPEVDTPGDTQMQKPPRREVTDTFRQAAERPQTVAV